MQIKKVNGWREIANPGVKHITVQMYITRRCNFACSYCTHYDNSEEFKTFEEYKDLIDTIYESVKDKDVIDISFFGGEPTIVPQFAELVEYILSTYPKVYVTITTNGSQSISWWSRLAKFKGRIHCFVTYQHKMQNLDDFVTRMRYLDLIGFIYYINVMLEPDDVPGVKMAMGFLRSDPFIGKYFVYSSIDFELDERYKDVTEHFETINYKLFPDQEFALRVEMKDGSVQYFKDHMSFKTAQLHCFKYYRCRVGREHLLLDSNGDIYCCLSHILSSVDPVGNVYTNNTLSQYAYSDGIICRWDKCVSELWIEKERIFS